MRLADLALILPALTLAACGPLLGIEERTYEDQNCATSADCRDKPGRFCNAGLCEEAPDNREACQILEPTGATDLQSFDWQAGNSVVLGALQRVHNKGEAARFDAMQLAVREVNGFGGLAGRRKLVLVTCDYGGPNGTDDGTTAQEAIEAGIDYLAGVLDAAVIIAGSSSASTKISIDTILSRGQPTAFISSFSTSTTLTTYDDRLAPSDPHGLLWRTSPNDFGQASVLAELIAGQAPAKLAIVYIDDPYGLALQENVNQDLANATNFAGELSLHQFTGSTTDFAPILGDVEASGADAMLFIGVDGEQVVDVYTVLATMPALNAQLTRHYLADAAKDGRTLFDSSLSTEVKAIIDKALGTAPYHSESSQYDTFASALRDGFGVDANNFSFLAQSYDATYVAAYGLSFAASNAERLDGHGVAEGISRLVSGKTIRVGAIDWSAGLAELAKPSGRIDLDGTSGPLDFDENGEALGPYEIWQPDTASGAFATCAICGSGETCDLSGSSCRSQ